MRLEKRKIVLLSIYDSFEILFNAVIATEKITTKIANNPINEKAPVGEISPKTARPVIPEVETVLITAINPKIIIMYNIAINGLCFAIICEKIVMYINLLKKNFNKFTLRKCKTFSLV